MFPLSQQITEHMEKEITLELRQQVQKVIVRNTRDALHMQYPLQMQQHTLVIMYVACIAQARALAPPVC